MMTDDIAAQDGSCTFPKLTAGSFRTDYSANQNGSPAAQLGSRDGRDRVSDESALTARVAGRTSSEVCHDVATFAAIIIVFAILVPLLLSFARVSF
jgi:hypothetical protein